MTTPEIKKQLHDHIDMIEDEGQLEMLHEAAEVYAARKQPDIVDSLTPEQLKRLQQSLIIVTARLCASVRLNLALIW